MDTVRHDEPTLPAAPWRDQPGLKRLADALGARDGDTRTCRLPDGHTISITLLAARPYGHDVAVLDRTGAAEG